MGVDENDRRLGKREFAILGWRILGGRTSHLRTHFGRVLHTLRTE